MRILVTGSAGHLGEALVRTLLEHPSHQPVGLDIKSTSHTDYVGTVADRQYVKRCMSGVDAVIHTATLHKPHIATHSRQAFVDTNITGTLNVLEEAVAAGVSRFIYTSTTSTFGRALVPPPGAPAAWITEDVMPLPKNIYGATKLAAEHLCEMFQHRSGMPCVVLRTSRFFPEADDDEAQREAFDADNLKVNELLYRRADIEDVVSAHLRALERAPALGFARYIISATSPFSRDDSELLRRDPASVVRRYAPEYPTAYAERGWSMMPSIDRVYVNDLARQQLGWQPTYDFARAIRLLRSGRDYRSALARAVGAKGYHTEPFATGPYPME